jgi:hypothetical protein
VPLGYQSSNHSAIPIISALKTRPVISTKATPQPHSPQHCHHRSLDLSSLMSKPSCAANPFTLSNALSLSAYIILFYDYVLTLPMEVDRYWCAGSHTWASTVFLGIRYLALVGHVPLLYHIYSPCEEEHMLALRPYTSLCLLTVTEHGFSPRTTTCWCSF